MINVRSDFPMCQKIFDGRRVVYLDSAASALKPLKVIDRLTTFYTSETANVHRGAHDLSDHATLEYESARKLTAQFLNSQSAEEVIFTRNTTEALNLVATSWGIENLKPGDEIWLTEMEHHSSLLPWQNVARRTGAVLKVIPVLDSGVLDLDFFMKNLGPKAKVLAMVMVSNASGVENSVDDFVRVAKNRNLLVVLDAAQAIVSQKLDVQKIGADFIAFSGHKIFGPYGIGVLWGQINRLNQLPPYQYGGSMIREVSFEKSEFLSSPHRFEAGTPNISGAIGLATAIGYFAEIKIENVRDHENQLRKQTEAELSKLDKLKIYAASAPRTNIIAFNYGNTHCSDVAQLLNQQGVMVRAGHLCCQPLMQRWKVPGVVRISFSIYNNEADVDQLLRAVHKLKEFF